jgi:YfiH family protein
MSRVNSGLKERALEKSEWTIEHIDGLTIVRSPLLSQHSNKLTHAFTTRLGGGSFDHLASFNLGRHIDDENVRADAMKNRERLCNVIGADYARLIVPGQVHSATVHVVKAADEERNLKEVDGVTTHLKGHPLLLHFADCVPIILYDPVREALAVVHAGWRGTAASIIKNAVHEMQSNFASRPQDILGAVGPAIGTCCYPTGEDAAEKLSRTVENASGLIERASASEQFRADLKALNAMQLYEAGLESVDVTDLCTACRPDIFYSHRQSGGKTGRQGAMAQLL